MVVLEIHYGSSFQLFLLFPEYDAEFPGTVLELELKF